MPRGLWYLATEQKDVSGMQFNSRATPVRKVLREMLQSEVSHGACSTAKGKMCGTERDVSGVQFDSLVLGLWQVLLEMLKIEVSC